MVNQAHIFDGQILWVWRGIDVEAWEWENPGALPLLNGCFDLGSPHKIRPVRGGRPILRDRDVVVRAANLVFRAVAAERIISVSPGRLPISEDIPLGKVLVTSDVSTFAIMVSANIQDSEQEKKVKRAYQVSQPLRDLVWLKILSTHEARHGRISCNSPPSGRTAARTSHC